MTSRRRRALVLASIALLMGTFAASDVARREAATGARLRPLIDVVVAESDLRAGKRIDPDDVQVRRLPARFVTAGVAAVPFEVVGERLAVAVPRGAALGRHLLALPDASPAVRRGERAAEVLAVASAEVVVPGARVDVIVTRDRAAGEGEARLALQDAEVLSAQPAEAAADGLPRVSATLRVTVREAVYLAAAQAFASEIRLLPRVDGDRRRSRGVEVGEGLR